MINLRTSIGIGVGSVVIAIGVIALITSIGVQSIPVDDTYAIGESTTYRFSAPAGTTQYVNITGSLFDISLSSPKGGLQIPEREHKNNVDIEWVHLEEGESILKITNTGDSELQVKGTIEAILDPMLITYRVLIIIAGLVIVGFSSAFSIRKPRGF